MQRRNIRAHTTRTRRLCALSTKVFLLILLVLLYIFYAVIVADFSGSADGAGGHHRGQESKGRWDTSIITKTTSQNEDDINNNTDLHVVDTALDDLLNALQLLADAIGVPPPVSGVEHEASLLCEKGKSETALYAEKYSADISPLSLLSSYFPTDSHTELIDSSNICSLNIEMENELLDDGYAQQKGPSPTSPHYRDPSHTHRRGYGSESSIFVSVTPPPMDYDTIFHEVTGTTNKWVWGPAAESYQAMCAMTVESIYRQARWPSGVHVAVTDVAFASAALHNSMGAKVDDEETEAPTKKNEPIPKQMPRGEASVHQVLSCLPKSFDGVGVDETRGFQYKDNIRRHRVVVPYSKTRIAQGAAVHNGTDIPLPYTAVHATRLAHLQLYKGESYVMFVSAGVLMGPAWDWRLRLMLIHSPDSHRAVLTTRPPEPILGQAADADSAWRVEALTRAYRRVMDSNTSSSGSDAGVPSQAAHVKGDAFLSVLKQPRMYELLAIPTLVHHRLASNPKLREAVDLGNPSEYVQRALQGLNFHSRLEKGDVSVALESSNVYITVKESLRLDEMWQYILNPNGDGSSNLVEVCGWYSSVTQTVDKKKCELCWLGQHREAIRNALVDIFFTAPPLAREADANDGVPTTSTLTILRSQSIDKTQNGASPPLPVRITTEHVPQDRGSDCLHDAQYIHPPGVRYNNTAMGGINLLKEATAVYSAGHLPSGSSVEFLLPHAFASHSFLFTRAEAFFDIPLDLRMVSTQKLFVNNDTREGPNPMSFDPYLHVLTDDEADVYLSAALWTHGYNLLAPTECVAVSVFSHPRELHRKKPHTDDESHGSLGDLTLLREATLRRLRQVFGTATTNHNNKAGNYNNNADARAVPGYDTTQQVHTGGFLGTQRSLTEYCEFAGFTF